MSSSRLDHAVGDNSRTEHFGAMKNVGAEQFIRRSLSKIALKFVERTKGIWADQRGVAAVEFAFFAIFLSFALASVTDVSIYIYQRMLSTLSTHAALPA